MTDREEIYSIPSRSIPSSQIGESEFCLAIKNEVKKNVMRGWFVDASRGT